MEYGKIESSEKTQLTEAVNNDTDNAKCLITNLLKTNA